MGVRALPIKRLKALVELHLEAVERAPADEIITSAKGEFVVQNERASGTNIAGAVEALTDLGFEIKTGRSADATWEVEVRLEHHGDKK